MNKNPRKEELKKAWREQEKQRLVTSIPMPHAELRALFDFLDGISQCDHTLKQTNQFLEQHKLNANRVIAWLQENGGHCDCEITANVEDKFGELV
jgi:Protein of unknown function (DUF2695)